MLELRRRFTSWWRSHRQQFLLVAFLVAAALVTAGWMTNLRHVMHGALLAVIVTALGPLLLIVGLLLALVLLALVVGIVGAIGGGDVSGLPIDGASQLAVSGGGKLARRYYGFLRRRRHPAFWGTAAGVAIGAAILGAAFAALVLPGEARTARTLAQARAAIEERYRDEGSFPRPDPQGHLLTSVLMGPAVSAAGSEIVLDGFGRPLRFEVSGRWKLASWRLRSLGYDGVPSRDDLCVTGATKLRKVASLAVEVERILMDVADGRSTARDDFAGIMALRCGES